MEGNFPGVGNLPLNNVSINDSDGKLVLRLRLKVKINK